MLGFLIFDSIYGVDVILIGIFVFSNVLKGMDENWFIVLFKDVFLEGFVGVNYEIKYIFVEVFVVILKVVVKRIL